MRWGLFIVFVCVPLFAEFPDQRRALQGFHGMGSSTAEAVVRAKAACFHWAEEFSLKQFLLGTPDCGNCLCPLSTKPACYCFGSLRYEAKLPCEKIRPRTIYHAAEASADHCGEAKILSADALYRWQAEQTDKEFVVGFTRPECYCTDSDVARATCRASITYAECPSPTH